jgi:hypothetical protein
VKEGTFRGPRFEDLVEAFLNHALSAGFEPPLIFVVVSVNGFVSAVRYVLGADGSLESEPLTEGNEPQGIFPINMCIFDSAGKMVNAKIDDVPGTGKIQ